jgi:hypothetical protein
MRAAAAVSVLPSPHPPPDPGRWYKCSDLGSRQSTAAARVVMRCHPLWPARGAVPRDDSDPSAVQRRAAAAAASRGAPRIELRTFHARSELISIADYIDANHLAPASPLQGGPMSRDRVRAGPMRAESRRRQGAGRADASGERVRVGPVGSPVPAPALAEPRGRGRRQRWLVLERRNGSWSLSAARGPRAGRPRTKPLARPRGCEAAWSRGRHSATCLWGRPATRWLGCEAPSPGHR